MSVDQLHDLESAGRMLGGVALSTMRRWAAQRRIPIVKLGSRVMVRESDLQKLIEANSIAANGEIAI